MRCGLLCLIITLQCAPSSASDSTGSPIARPSAHAGFMSSPLPPDHLVDLLADGSPGPVLVLQRGGSILFGATARADGSLEPPGTPLRVAVPGFAIGRTEITVAQFGTFAERSGYRTDAERDLPVASDQGEQPGCQVPHRKLPLWRAGASWRDPGFRQSPEHPAVCLSWNDAQAYVEWLSAQTGARYRLPSEAEFERVLPDSSDGRYPWGDEVDDPAACALAHVATCVAVRSGTRPAGQLRPNRHGLLDLSGNAWEWAGDCWSDHLPGVPLDGSARQDGDCTRSPLRGGAWDEGAKYAATHYRGNLMRSSRSNATGFRVVREL